MARLPALFLLLATAAPLELRLDSRSAPRFTNRPADSKIDQHIRDSGYRDDRGGKENKYQVHENASNLTLFCCDVVPGYEKYFVDNSLFDIKKRFTYGHSITGMQKFFPYLRKSDRSYTHFLSRGVRGKFRLKRNSGVNENGETRLYASHVPVFEPSLSSKENGHLRYDREETTEYVGKTNKPFYKSELLVNHETVVTNYDKTSLLKNFSRTIVNVSKTAPEVILDNQGSTLGTSLPSLSQHFASQPAETEDLSSHVNMNSTKLGRNERDSANTTLTMINSNQITSGNSPNSPDPPSEMQKGTNLPSTHQPSPNLTSAHQPPRSLASAPKPVPGLKDSPVSRRNQGRERTIYRTPSFKSLQAARELLQKKPLVDGHNDLPWNVRVLLHNQLQNFNLSSDLMRLPAFRNSGFSHTDMPRLKAGLVGAQIWSVHIPCGAQFRNAVQLLVEQIDVVRRMLHDCDQTTLVTTPDALKTAWSQGLLASMISVGGGHGLGSSVGVLRSLHELGVTSISLTHSCHTPWAEGDEDAEGQFTERGLTSFGKAIVRELNRLGMMVDISHASAATARDAITTSRAPVIISHTAARAICNLPRNVPDSILHALRTSGGLAMVTFDSDFLACGRNATIRTVIDHLEHIRRVAGVDHVGLGSAFDGFDRPAHGLQDTSQYPALFASLMEARPAWSREDLLKLSGENFIRVFRRVKEVQAKLSEERPSEDIIPFKDIDTRWPCRYKFTKADHPYT